MRSIRKSMCPSQFCGAANPVQALVSTQQADAAQEQALLGAVLCCGCGCVYVRDARGMSHVIGTLRREGKRYRWLSAYRQTNSAPGSTR